jgi:hypothetical protein
MRRSSVWIIEIAMLIGILILPAGIVRGQRQPPRGIDMVLVIDNSRSMFANKNAQGILDKALGSDPDLLRITGAGIFISQLGLDAPNPEEFQIAVISLGEAPPKVFAHLTPLGSPKIRGALYESIANPVPENQTRIIEALKSAYAELASPRHRTDNIPVIVLLTDGEPFPREGQSNEDIETLVASHPEVFLFVILLHNPQVEIPGSELAERFGEYIRFWNDLQKYTHVHTYEARDKGELTNLYFQIQQQLVGGPVRPSEMGELLPPGKCLDTVVNEFARKMTIVGVHPLMSRAQIQVRGPRGIIRGDEGPEKGVYHFWVEQCPIEVYIIKGETLIPGRWQACAPKESEVYIRVEKEASFHIRILKPEVIATGIPNEYQAKETFSPSLPMHVEFQVVNERGEPLAEAFELKGTVSSAGRPTESIPKENFSFNSQSMIYTLNYSFLDPQLRQRGAWYVITLEASLIDIATAVSLRVQVGPRPQILQVSPTRVEVHKGQPVLVTVTVSDYDGLQKGAIVEVLNPVTGGRITLEDKGPTPDGRLGTFAGDIAQILSQTGSQNLTVRLTGHTKEGLKVDDTLEGALTVIVLGPLPSPTPIPTPTAVPTPRVVKTPFGTVRADLLPLWLIGILALLTSPLWGPWFYHFVGTLLMARLDRLPIGYIRITRIDPKTNRVLGNPEVYNVYDYARGIHRWIITLGTKGNILLEDDGSGKIGPVALKIWRREGKTFIGQPKGEAKTFDKFERDIRLGSLYIIAYSTEPLKQR